MDARGISGGDTWNSGLQPRWNVIVSNPLQIECGMAMLRDAAGTGVEWNEDGIDRCIA
jgi:hypothetical protein